jgi:hypothetical protein
VADAQVRGLRYPTPVNALTTPLAMPAANASVRAA